MTDAGARQRLVQQVVAKMRKSSREARAMTGPHRDQHQVWANCCDFWIANLDAMAALSEGEASPQARQVEIERLEPSYEAEREWQILMHGLLKDDGAASLPRQVQALAFLRIWANSFLLKGLTWDIPETMGNALNQVVTILNAALSEGEASPHDKYCELLLGKARCDCGLGLSEGEAPPSRRAMLEHLASDTCRGNRHENFLENCPVCWSRLQRLEGALVEGETSGALEIAPGVFRATTSSSIFTEYYSPAGEARAVPPDLRGYEQHKPGCAIPQECATLSWSDRGSGEYKPDEFTEMVVNCSLDHFYDRTSDGVPDGMPKEYAEAFAPVVACRLSGIESDWKNRTIYMSESQRAAFTADLMAAYLSVRARIGAAKCTCGLDALLAGEGRAAPEPETGWQPIATAPKDGMWFLGYELDESLKVLRWDTDMEDHNPAWRDRECYEHEPTHWRPLPPPPAPEREDK